MQTKLCNLFLRLRSLAIGERCPKVDNVLLYLVFHISCQSEATPTVACTLPRPEFGAHKTEEHVEGRLHLHVGNSIVAMTATWDSRAKVAIPTAQFH
jgi:hypothetical protein